jgi:hypothetical protein
MSIDKLYNNNTSIIVRGITYHFINDNIGNTGNCLLFEI